MYIVLVKHFHEVIQSEAFNGQQRLSFTLKYPHRMLEFHLPSLTVATNPSGSAAAVTNTTAGPDVPVKSSTDLVLRPEAGLSGVQLYFFRF